MCIGIPMQVVAMREGFAQATGRGEQREVSTALVGPVQPGYWLLVFLDGARELIDAARAAEVNATLDLVQAAMDGGQPDPRHDPGFSLPSAMTAEQLAALAGQ
ncbi:HypC/HybG/HupF family hydrogenase formation chaperone [Ideonella sp. DXS22W]|uniref:HypC/HybG/HupF family hydrogenase formation chaperone n=1 Tax=Pseudaquabacterium inlustre TaxID=2984192 RepID=A0ABU9CJH0_9BURK